MDPYQRAPRSPKNRKPGEPGLQGLSQTNVSDDTKSPTSDQVCHVLICLIVALWWFTSWSENHRFTI